jgi:hypothetical protein
MDTISQDCRLCQLRAPELNRLAGIHFGNHYTVPTFDSGLSVDSPYKRP